MFPGCFAVVGDHRAEEAGWRRRGRWWRQPSPGGVRGQWTPRGRLGAERRGGRGPRSSLQGVQTNAKFIGLSQSSQETIFINRYLVKSLLLKHNNYVFLFSWIFVQTEIVVYDMFFNCFKGKSCKYFVHNCTLESLFFRKSLQPFHSQVFDLRGKFKQQSCNNHQP